MAYPPRNIDDLPPLGDTEASIRKYLKFLAYLTARDIVEHTRAKVLNDMARTKLAALTQENERRELETLRQMLRDAQDLENRGAEREAADRQHASVDTEAPDEP